MMQALLSDAIIDLRRPFRLRGSTSRRAFAGLALLTAAVLLGLVVLGVLLAGPVHMPAPENASQYPFDPLREPIMRWVSAMPGAVQIAICVTLVPLLFAMVRRSTDIGLPRLLSVAGVVVLVVSALSFFLALDQRIAFPLTRGLWTLAVADAEDLSAKIGIVIVLSPVFLFTVIGDLLIILLVGLVAFVCMVISLLAAFIIGCMPTRKDLQT